MGLSHFSIYSNLLINSSKEIFVYALSGRADHLSCSSYFFER